MKKGETKGKDGLKHLVYTRINDAKYAELKQLVIQSKTETISSIVRKIIYDRKLKVYKHDESVDLLLEELASLRGEIKAIGININQITKYFNTYHEMKKKEFYAKIGLKAFINMEDKMDKAIDLISIIGKTWLSR